MTSHWPARIGRYLWGGWTGVASVLLFVAAWDALSRQVGPLVLPTPLETLASLRQIDRLFTDAPPPSPFDRLLADAEVQCVVAQ